MQDLSRQTLKRLKNDYKLLRKSKDPNFEAQPDPNNLLIWWVLIKGSKDTDYEGGYYLIKIIHDKNYPINPPNFMMMTPSGRYIIEQKICISNTTYHANEWSPSWTIESQIVGFISIMNDDREHGISHIKRPSHLRKKLAKESLEYNKNKFPEQMKLFKKMLDDNGNPI